MTFLKLLNIILLYNILIFIGPITSSLEENLENDEYLTNSYPLPNYIMPYHYTIIISWPDDQSEITYFLGECRIYIKIYNSTHRISLHVQTPQINVNVNALLIKETNSNKEKIYYTPHHETYNSTKQILNFHFTEEIPRGNYSLVMKFITFLNDDNESIFKGSYVDSTGNAAWLYATHFQTIGARQIFPCWDEPKFKATFNISIKYHKDYIVLWNTNYETDTDFNDTTIRSMRINIPFKISTYHIAFCLLKARWFTFTISTEYNLNSASINSPKSIVWNRHSSQTFFAQEVIQQISKSFKNDFENWEKISLTQHVFIPGLRHEAIEKWGLILYREGAVAYDEKLDSLAHKIEVASLIARQVAYQWFGITVSPTWWSYHWLNQGIATLLGIDVLDKNFPDFRASDLFVVQIQQESLRIDQNSEVMKSVVSKVRQPSDINLSFSYYIKAPVILRMLRYILSDTIFRKGIEFFYKRQLFGSATFDNFCDDMQIIYNSRTQFPTKPITIKDMMRAWTTLRHYPELNVKPAKDTPCLIIELGNCLNIMLSNYEWWIPITITKQTAPNFTISAKWHVKEWIIISLKNYFKPQHYNFSVRKDEWYIINIQQIGYYRVNYNLKNWKNIARYLNSAKYTNIHVLNRAQIIDDAYYFAKRDILKFSMFLILTEYLWRETDYVAWYPMFKALEDMSLIFSFPEKFNVIKTKILNSLNGLLQNIDYDKKPDEKSNDLIDCLRQEARKWACILGVPNCTKIAVTKLHQYLINPETTKFLPWTHWTFCKGLIRANASIEIWTEIWNKHIQNSNTITSNFLTCSDNSSIIIKYAEMLFNNFNEEMGNNYLNDIHRIIMNHANNNEVLDNILRNLKKIPREYSIATLIDIINHVYSEKQLNQIKEFVNTYNEEATEQLLFNKTLKINFLTKIDKLVTLINDKIEIRNSEISRHLSHLNKLYKV